MNKNTFLHLALGAYLGVSLRIHIIELVSQHMVNGAIPLDIIDNFLGSFVIGFYNDKYKTRDFSSHLAIGTGFCGCLTTFSSWIIGNILLLKQNLIFDSSMNLFIGISIAYCGYKLGQEADQQLNFPFHKQFYFIVILTTIFFQIIFFKWNIIIAALLGPLGALFRFHLSKLNKIYFPFGTFLCNVIAVIIAALLTSNLQESSHTFQVGITIVIRGFCGGLSTVSTFIKELCTLEKGEYFLFYLWISIFFNIYFGWLIILVLQ